MKKHRFGTRPATFVVRLASAAALTLCLAQCSSEQPPDADENLGSISSALEHCGGVTCAGSSDCLSNMPVCASTTGVVCTAGPPRECIYKLNTGSSSCPCLEHDVRLCTVSGGAAGVQICTRSSSTATFWSTCQTTPACSP
jgi:uncharacterized membrane protein